MAHNVPCPSCGHELALSIADDGPKVDSVTGWARLEADLAALNPAPTGDLGWDALDRNGNLAVVTEEPPALAPTERKYLLELTVEYFGGEPIVSPDEFALFTWASFRPGSGVLNVRPLVRIEMEACEPEELVKMTSEVAVRMSTTPNAHGCPSVELTGPRAAVLEFVRDNWGEGYTDAEFDEYVVKELR